VLLHRSFDRLNGGYTNCQTYSRLRPFLTFDFSYAQADLADTGLSASSDLRRHCQTLRTP